MPRVCLLCAAWAALLALTSACTTHDPVAPPSPRPDLSSDQKNSRDPAPTEGAAAASLRAALEAWPKAFDTATGELRGAELAAQLRTALDGDGPPEVTREARYRLAVLLLEWATVCRVGLDVAGQDPDRQRALFEQWETLQATAANSGRGRVDVAALIAAATGSPVTPDDDGDKQDDEGDEDIVEAELQFPLKDLAEQVRPGLEPLAQSVASLLAPLTALEPTSPWRAKAQLALDYLAVIGKMPDRWVVDPTATGALEVAVGVNADRLLRLIGSEAAGPLRDDAWLLLRLTAERHLSCVDGPPSFAPLFGLYYDLIEGAASDPAVRTRELEQALMSTELPRGAWPGIDADLRYVAWLAAKLGLEDDPGWAVPERFLRWSQALGERFVAELDRRADAAPGNGGAMRLLAHMCGFEHKPGVDADPRCQPVLAAQKLNSPRFLRLAVKYKRQLTAGYLAAQGIDPKAGRDSAWLTSFEAVAQKRWSRLEERHCELPLVANAVVGAVEARFKREGLFEGSEWDLRTRRGGLLLQHFRPRSQVMLVRGYTDLLGACLDGAKPGCLAEIVTTALESAREPDAPSASWRDVAPLPLGSMPDFEGAKVKTHEIDRTWLSAQLADLSKLGTQARIVPNYRDGSYQGFKLVGVRPGSIYRRIGIRSGDVIRRIDGAAIDSPNKAIVVFEKLKLAPKRLVLDVERGGRPLRLVLVLGTGTRGADER